jgi:hypothetical protein
LKELDYWTPDDAFPKSLKKVTLRSPELTLCLDPLVELLVHSSRDDGELKRVFEISKVFRHTIASHLQELRVGGTLSFVRLATLLIRSCLALSPGLPHRSGIPNQELSIASTGRGRYEL